MAHFLCVFHYITHICPLSDDTRTSVCVRRCANCDGKIFLTMTWFFPQKSCLHLCYITFYFFPSPDAFMLWHNIYDIAQHLCYSINAKNKTKPLPLSLKSQGLSVLYNRFWRISALFKLLENNFLVWWRGKDMKKRTRKADAGKSLWETVLYSACFSEQPPREFLGGGGR